MSKWLLIIVICALIALTAVNPVSARAESEPVKDPRWRFGFGRRQIIPPEGNKDPLYIAGYNNGVEISDVLDYCEARAVWIDAGSEGVLLIGVDCVALDSGTVKSIRDRLGDISGCAGVMVYATHTHAGPDTLGLWGPVGANGKNEGYMRALIQAAEEAGREAAAAPREASLYYGAVKTSNMYRDSRYPTCYDENLYQLRFSPEDGGAGLRLMFYGAHAESLRGANRLLSRDYPGLLCDHIKENTGDDAMFFPGAIGGLIMTREFVSDVSVNAVKNLNITADRLIEYALGISPDSERTLAADMRLSVRHFTVPLDNTVFLLYKTLGILNHMALPDKSATGLAVVSELDALMLGDVCIALIPGEIFPELVLGGVYGDANPEAENPTPLKEIAARHGVENLLIVGLANDELGYIVPPSDFLLNEKQPYLARTMDKRGEDHYEETNSVGPECAARIAEAFDAALEALD